MARAQTSLVRLARRVLAPDTIGPAICPILYRWTLFPLGCGSNSSSSQHLQTVPDWLPKLLLHHFLPQADERHFHDHPRGFCTLVLRGGYDDLVPCERCDGTGTVDYSGTLDWQSAYDIRCPRCEGTGTQLGDEMRPGRLAYRPSEHRHRTRVHPEGAWTLVLMGPKRREWGFWLGRRFIEWQPYFKQFGYGMRCV